MQVKKEEERVRFCFRGAENKKSDGDRVVDVMVATCHGEETDGWPASGHRRDVVAFLHAQARDLILAGSGLTNSDNERVGSMWGPHAGE